MTDMGTTATLELVRRRARDYQEAMVQTLQGLLSFPSINPTPENVSEATVSALQFALGEAGRLGLAVRNLDDLAGFAELGPADASETVGVLAHLDVVPAGSGWTHPPFAGVVANGCVWGRGAEDDKGPAVAALYAMKALADINPPLSRKVRLIFGTNEEQGNWIGVQRYAAAEGAPTMGFTPDGEFPVICGEKGFLNVDLRAPRRPLATDGGYRVMAWRAGEATNMVPALAWAALRVPAVRVATALHDINEAAAAYTETHPGCHLTAINEAEFAARFPEDPRPACDLAIVAHGREAHSATPWDGRNAMLDLAGLLAQLDLAGDAHGQLARFVAERMGDAWDGEGLGLAVSDPKLGPTTVNLSVARTGSDAASVLLNLRLTPPHTVASATATLRQTAQEAGIELSAGAHAMEPLFVDESDPLVVALKEAYTMVTGQPADCQYIGGTTYAKAFPRTVAYGPAMPGEQGLAHQVDERVSIDTLVRNAEIYAVALYQLTR